MPLRVQVLAGPKLSLRIRAKLFSAILQIISTISLNDSEKKTFVGNHAVIFTEMNSPNNFIGR